MQRDIKAASLQRLQSLLTSSVRNWSCHTPNYPLKGWHDATDHFWLWLVERPIRSDKFWPLLQMMWLIDTCLIINLEHISPQQAENLSERSYCGNPFGFFLLEIEYVTAQLYSSFTASSVRRSNHRLILSQRLRFRSCWNTFFRWKLSTMFKHLEN